MLDLFLRKKFDFFSLKLIVSDYKRSTKLYLDCLKTELIGLILPFLLLIMTLAVFENLRSLSIILAFMIVFAMQLFIILSSSACF